MTSSYSKNSYTTPGIYTIAQAINVDNTEKSQMINDMVSDLRNETDIQERIDADVYQITYTGECEDNDQFEEDTDQFY